MLTKEQKKARQKLITALRSGTYQQGRGRLKNPLDNTFCCQGVACDLISQNWETWCFPNYAIWNNTLQKTEWPNDVREHYGFTREDSSALMAMNDGVGAVTQDSGYHIMEPCTFEEIADAMEFLTLANL